MSDVSKKSKKSKKKKLKKKKLLSEEGGAAFDKRIGSSSTSSSKKRKRMLDVASSSSSLVSDGALLVNSSSKKATNIFASLEIEEEVVEEKITVSVELEQEQSATNGAAKTSVDVADDEIITNVYGENAEVELVFKNAFGPNAGGTILGVTGVPSPKIDTLALQNFLTWTLADGDALKWMIVRNKPLISRVLFIAVDGLDEALFERVGEKHCPFLWNMKRCSLRAPGNDSRNFSGQFIFISQRFNPAKREEKKRRREEIERNTALNIQQQEANEGQSVKRTRRGARGSKTANVLVSNVTGESSVPKLPRAQTASFFILKESELLQNGFPLSADVIEKMKCSGAMSAEKIESLLENVPDTSSFKQAPPYDEAVHGALTQRPDEMDLLIALDCEMCTTTAGPELSKIAVVSHDGTVLFNEFVKTTHEVVDYLTQYSGVTAEDLAAASWTLADAQQNLFQHVHSQSILVGHSLENDLRALQVVHNRIIDTSVIYPRSGGGDSSKPFQYKHALRFLTQRYLNRHIQQGRSHLPHEDAVAALDLAKLKVSMGKNFGLDKGTPKDDDYENIFDALSRSGHRCAFVDRPSLVNAYLPSASAKIDALPCSSDEDIIETVKRCLRKPIAALGQSTGLDTATATATVATTSTTTTTTTTTTTATAAAATTAASTTAAATTTTTTAISSSSAVDSKSVSVDGHSHRFIWAQLKDLASLASKEIASIEEIERLALDGVLNEGDEAPANPLSLVEVDCLSDELYAAELKTLDERLQEVYEHCPRNTIVVTFSVQGFGVIGERWSAARKILKGKKQWTPQCDERMKRALERSRNGLAFFAVKKDD